MGYLKYLTQNVLTFLAHRPFCDWVHEISVEDDYSAPAMVVSFPQNGLEVQCDPNGNISTIFLYSREYEGFDDTLLEVSFSMSRLDVFRMLGDPVKSGGPYSHAILGEYGRWDQFQIGENYLHFSFKLDVDQVDQITMMTPESRP